MKTLKPKCLALIALIMTMTATASAQTYSIDWYKVSGGGGTSTGGVYSISGTIAQPDANQQPMRGGMYSLTGGFSSLFALQTPGAPLLTITPSLPNLILSWPVPSTGFGLQQNAGLEQTNPWSMVGNPVVVTNGENTVTVPVSVGVRFYRLNK